MRLSIKNLSTIINSYKSSLINKRIEDVTLVNSRLFLFTIKHLDKKLVIDLDNTNPHIGLIQTDYDELSLPNNFIKKLLTKGKPLINDIELVNNDKVIRITTSATDAYYHRNTFYLYIELINSHANMILTNSENIILGAFYETNLSAPRLIVTNNKYQLPESKTNDIDNPFISLKEYQNYVDKSFKDSIEKRKKELFGPIVKKHEKRVKGLIRKINKIKEERDLAKQSNNYKEYGEIILMNANEIHKGDKEYKTIKLDPTKSPIENANIYFNKYKKSKRALLSTAEILIELNKELENEQYQLDILKLSTEEEINNLINNKSNNHNNNKNEKAYLPYFIKYKETIYYYGKNSLENDYLSFKMFKNSSDVTWLHLKDKPSSHLIINKSNPSNEELDIACSLILFISKENPCEIMYTNRCNITRGDKLGEANISAYKSINMRKINSLVYDLIKREKRCHE